MEKDNIVLIKRQNKPIGILYPYGYKKTESTQQDTEEKKRRVFFLLEQWQKKWGSKKYPGERNTTAMIREMRDNRFGKRFFKKKTNY